MKELLEEQKRILEEKKKLREAETMNHLQIVKALSLDLKIPVGDISIGTWDCETSPIGVCVYNTKEDHYEDDCLYCHEPDERK